MSGTIVFGGFSIGNIKDIPIRVLELIDTADIVAVEYLNSFQNYANILNKKPKKIIEYRNNIEGFYELTKYLTFAAKHGKTVLYLVDGGMPLVGDPGHLLSKMAIDEGVKITSIPGPSAVTCAVAVSGFFANDFIFLHNIPKLKSDRIDLFTSYKNTSGLIVFILPPSYNIVLASTNNNQESLDSNMLINIVEDMIFIFGENRRAALCFNMTMDNELIIRDSLDRCLDWIKNNKIYDFLTVVVDREEKIYDII